MEYISFQNLLYPDQLDKLSAEERQKYLFSGILEMMGCKDVRILIQASNLLMIFVLILLRPECHSVCQVVSSFI